MSTDKKIDLVLNLLSKQKYDELKSGNNLEDNELYLVKEEGLDAQGNTIINVAEPENPTDAATKAYVDSKGDSKKLFSQDEQQYINGEGEVYKWESDREEVQTFTDTSRNITYKCVSGNQYDGVWESINTPTQGEWKISVWMEHYDDWYSYGDLDIDAWSASVRQDDDGRWFIWVYCYTTDSEIKSDYGYDSYDSAYYSYDSQFTVDGQTGYVSHNVMDEPFFSLWHNDDQISDGYGQLYDGCEFYDYNTGGYITFSEGRGKYGDIIPGTEDWRKKDAVALKSDIQVVESEIPTKTSQLENNSGFVTSSHNHSEYQISGLSSKLTGIQSNSITKSTGTITTLSSTNITASTSIKVGGVDVATKNDVKEVRDYVDELMVNIEELINGI